MGGITELIESLESKLTKLQLKLETLQRSNHELGLELERYKAQISSQEGDIAALKQQNESLKLANSLLGSDENKRETKLKINSLIREIDYCIAQLSD